VRVWEVGGELRWRWRGEADLFESVWEGLRCYASCGGRVEDFEAGAQSVEERGWEGGVGAGATGWGCGSGWAALRVMALLFWGSGGV
jgi:hypothetical protein